MRRLAMFLTAVCAVGLASCFGQDSDFFPSRMKGLNAWVYDASSGKEFSAGFVEAGYTSRKQGLACCAALASSAAAGWHIENWSYVCCTVTLSSQCETKVR